MDNYTTVCKVTECGVVVDVARFATLFYPFVMNSLHLKKKIC